MISTLEPPVLQAADPKPPPRRRLPLGLLVVLVLAATVIADVSVPGLVPAAAVGLVIVVPAMALRAKATRAVTSPAARTLYAFGAAVLLVMTVGLILNTTLPLIGESQPLRRVPLVVTFAVVDLALLGWRPGVPVGPGIGWFAWLQRLVLARADAAAVLAVGSLVLGVAGAVRLNNDAGGGVAVTARICAGLALLLLFRDRGATRDLRTIGLVALSLLMSTSLRGWAITGHDIQREYIAFLLTNGSHHWSMAPFQSAYNACLSINIVPTVLAQTTGLSGVVVFKVLMQLTMAAVPVATYVMTRRLVSRRAAVLAAVVVMMFPTFFNDMPYLVRHEVAFLFLALLLLVGTERAWSVRTRRLWVCVFGVGIVLSHYSTTYMLLIGLVLAYVGLTVSVQWSRLLARRRGESPPTRTRHAIVCLPVIALLVAASWAWSGPATHTAGHVEETAQQTLSILLGRSPSMPGSTDLNYNVFSRQHVSEQERLRLFATQAFENRRNVPADDLVVQDPGARLLHPRSVATSDLPLTGIGQHLQDIGASPHQINTALRTGSAALLQLLLLLGTVTILVAPRVVPKMSREARWLAVGAIGAAGVVVLVPSLSAEYGALRAFQQALLVLAPVVVVGADTVLRPLRRAARGVVTLIWAAMFLSLTGVVTSLLGGYPGQLALSNSGLYYDLYYVRQPEVDAAGWIARASASAPVQSEVVSDKVAAARLQRSLGGKAQVSADFYPLSLQRGNYVYLGSETVQRHRATVFYTGTLLSYLYPVHILDNKLDVVYSTDLARVYR